MDNAELILKTLDQHLDHPVRLILYGRAALLLGFAEPPAEISLSKDVDGIIPLSDLENLTADENFWNAQDATNAVDASLECAMFKALSCTANNRMQPLKINFSNRHVDFLINEFTLFIAVNTNGQDLDLLSSF